MNKGMLTGIVAGVGIAVAGGVAGFALLGSSSDTADVDSQVEADAQVASDPAPATGSASASASAPAPAPAVVEECWDEEVTVQADPRDEKAIAGTAAGAVIGGALADRLGDDDDLVTAAGAAAGAFIGRKAQREFQENRTTTTTVRRCAPVETN
jgi:uncharacterized protein YcfJ